jgi:hypothetical protein
MTAQDLNTKLEQLVKDNLGKPVEREDASNLDQCYDWFFAYCDAIGVPRAAVRHLRAYEIWTLANDETKKYFDLIPNSPTFVPQKWDVGIFGTAVGVSGHVCVCSGNNSGLDTFQSTDQNWAGHAYVEYIWHNYNGFLGVLRPKVQATPVVVPSDTQAIIDQLRAERDRNWNMFIETDKLLKEAQVKLGEKDARIKELGDLVLKLQDRLARIKTITNEA